MVQRVNARLGEILGLIESKMKTYLEICETEAQQLFLLNYFYNILDSHSAKWFSYGLEEQEGPYFQYDNDEFESKYYPSALRWYEINNPAIRKAVEPLEFELYPQYKVFDETKNKEYKIDFALFYPRTDNLGEKIKVAIDCGRMSQTTPIRQMERENQRDRFLQSKGWLIARFTGSEIVKKDIYDLIGEVEKLAMNKDYELFQETSKHHINWRWN